ncbi:adenylate kinase family protein [Bosea sp. RAC05]|uniref:adenylate kinase family protein n=1 Tax=Bosea sp. RAC05 TaxID=1842539 RepID=UPI00083DD558|nr:nucleoside monophosphate kinase [Bosea sp. RAC05]AOG03358.1 AAA domain protein [Bosea sp. RAC05]
MTSRLILMGAPGAGKGTQAKMLAARFGLRHLSTGDMLRKLGATDTDLGREVSALINAGGFVDDALGTKIVRETLVSDGESGFLLDGYPRNVAQAHLCIDLLDEMGLPADYVIQIDVDERAILARIEARAEHARSLGMEPRADDNADVVGRRLQIWRETTLPALAVFEPRGIVRRVDGNAPAEVVQDRILRAIA